MKLDWTEKPGGFDMRDLRDFMKRSVSNDEMTGTTLSYIISVERRRAIHREHPRYDDFPALELKVEADCKRYLDTLVELGYIEIRADKPLDTYYQQTLAGSSFAMASPRRFSRKSAQKQLDEFLRRCRELNSQAPNIDDPETIYQVDSVTLFGSFANDDSSGIGDVDLCRILSIRDPDMYRKYGNTLIQEYALAEVFSHDPELQVRKRLRKGLTILSVGHQLPDGVTVVTIFDRAAG